MRLRISSYLVLAALLLITPGIALAQSAALVASYDVGDLGIEVAEYGGLVLDNNLNIWFAARCQSGTASSRPALCRIDLYTNRVTTYKLPTVIREVGALVYDGKKNLIWFADNEGRALCKFNILNRRVTIYDLPIANGDLADIQSIVLDASGKVFLALWETGAVGIFDPMAPTKLEMWASPDEPVNPYSIDMDEAGEVAWFTAGLGDWIFGRLVVNPGPPDLTPDMDVWKSTEASEMDTYCLRWDPDVGTDGEVFITADANETGPGELGKFDPAVTPAELRRYGVCSENPGLYGLDMQAGDEMAWIAEWELPGALAKVDATGDGIDPPVALTATHIESLDYEAPSVPGPWIYQISPRVALLNPDISWSMDRCQGGEEDTEEYPLGFLSQPTAVEVLDYPMDGFDLHISFVSDPFDDAVVLVLEPFFL